MSQVLKVDVFPESPSRDIIYVKYRTREVLFYTPLGFKNFSASLPAPNKLTLDTSITQLGKPGPFEDITHYSDFSFSAKHINVNSSELGISGVFTEEEELYNGHPSYSRTLDILDQSLFTSTNQNFIDIVLALGSQYKINSPVGPEFNQSLFSSVWQNENSYALSIKNIDQNTYAWEVNAVLNLSSGSVADIIFRSIDKLENPTEFQKDNFTPIGQYEIFSINID